VQRLPRRERVLVGVWLVLVLALWNGLYDLTLNEGIKEYLFRSALHDAGRGPRVLVATVMDRSVQKAVWVSTFWSSLVLLAGLVTIRTLRSRETSR
jgi:hypothetical protein